MIAVPTSPSHELWGGLCPPGGRGPHPHVERPFIYAQGPLSPDTNIFGPTIVWRQTFTVSLTYHVLRNFHACVITVPSS